MSTDKGRMALLDKIFLKNQKKQKGAKKPKNQLESITKVKKVETLIRKNVKAFLHKKKKIGF